MTRGKLHDLEMEIHIASKMINHAMNEISIDENIFFKLSQNLISASRKAEKIANLLQQTKRNKLHA